MSLSEILPLAKVGPVSLEDNPLGGTLTHMPWFYTAIAHALV